jgi:hypothetical protein
MGAFLGDGCVEGAVGVVGLVDVEGGEVEGRPQSEGQSEDEQLVGPTVFEYLAHQSPAALHDGLRIPAGHYLRLPSCVTGRLPKTGLTVWE